MKTKLTVTVDERVIPEAKRYAKKQGTSLSRLIEQTLREVSTEEAGTFSRRWRGKFKAAERNEKRYQLLGKKYF